VSGAAGVVLCGGAGTRLGRDKALLRIGDTTMVERAAHRLREVCDPVFIAAGRRRLEVDGCETLADAAQGYGPLGGLVAALRATPHEHLAAVAVDMPWIDTRLIRLLLDAIGDHDACVPLTRGGPEPLHSVYALSAIDTCEAALTGTDRSLRGVLGGLRVRYVAEDEWRASGVDPGFAHNVNTPADLAALTEPEAR
jgi:molybdenum cofactor guanylyltransferase